MARDTMGDLVAFLAVARERSFTRAAAQLGVSASALSHTIRKLEERVGVRLLTRTTRSVSTTEAGERLLRTIGPHFDEIQPRSGRPERASGQAGRHDPHHVGRPSGPNHPVAGTGETSPAISRHPRRDQRRRHSARYRRGAVRCGCPAGRAGRQGHDRSADRSRLHKWSSSVHLRTSRNMPARARPMTLRSTNASTCACAPLGGFYAWEFEKGGRELKVRVEGQVAFNDERLIIKAARAGLGLAYVFGDTVEAELAERSADPRARRLDAALRRLSSLLPEPPPAIASLRFAGRSPSISQVANVRFPPIPDIRA